MPKLTPDIYTPVHESAPCAHHKPLHNHMIIHMDLLIYTHIHKILPHNNHTPLYPHTNIHKNHHVPACHPDHKIS